MLQGKRDFSISRLRSGGVITNYHCTSACGHCLYCCSPQREKDYIDQRTLILNLKKIMHLGCPAIHIGGGEPFLNPHGLKMVIETAHSMNMHIEYVETNASWFRDSDSAREILVSLMKRGLSTLLISMSPFHNAHVPFFKVKGVMAACSAVGMNIFPWIPEFYPEIDAFDDKHTHTLTEYKDRYGGDYLKRLPSRYWVHFGGRALATFSTVFGLSPCREILSSNNRGCIELLGVDHFHLDLFGNYIPGLCSGLAIRRDDLGSVISPKKYPLLHLLFHKGVTGLFDFVADSTDFMPAHGYLSKCHLCLDLRRYLALNEGTTFQELQPKGFYGDV